jgi:photosystem II reaction center protein PsbM
MEVNILGLIAVLLFVLIPTSFLLILYVKTASRELINWPAHYYQNYIEILTQIHLSQRSSLGLKVKLRS